MIFVETCRAVPNQFDINADDGTPLFYFRARNGYWALYRHDDLFTELVDGTDPDAGYWGPTEARRRAEVAVAEWLSCDVG